MYTHDTYILLFTMTIIVITILGPASRLHGRRAARPAGPLAGDGRTHNL